MNPDVIFRADQFEFSLELVCYRKFVDEGVYALFGNALVFAREALECFVWFFKAFATQNSLNSFGYNRPVVVEVLGEGEETYFMMSVGEYCGDGTFPGNGMVISLYRYGDDPGDDACWRLEYVDEATLELRDFKGDQGAVTFTRMTE